VEVSPMDESGDEDTSGSSGEDGVAASSPVLVKGAAVGSSSFGPLEENSDSMNSRRKGKQMQCGKISGRDDAQNSSDGERSFDEREALASQVLFSWAAFAPPWPSPLPSASSSRSPSPFHEFDDPSDSPYNPSTYAPDDYSSPTTRVLRRSTTEMKRRIEIVQAKIQSKPKKKRGNLPESATRVLKQWIYDHAAHPYPSEEEKVGLEAKTNLSLNQVNNWFTNARRRILPKKKGHGSTRVMSFQLASHRRRQACHRRIQLAHQRLLFPLQSLPSSSMADYEECTAVQQTEQVRLEHTVHPHPLRLSSPPVSRMTMNSQSSALFSML